MHRLNLATLAFVVIALGLVAPATADAKPFQLAKDKTLFEQKGCLLISKDRKEIACIHHELDMGYYDSTLTIHAASGPYKGKTRFKIYAGQSRFEAKGLGKDFQKANAYLAKQGFTQTGVAKDDNGTVRGYTFYASIEHGGAYFKATGQLPSTEGWKKKERQCCGWEPKTAVVFPKAKKVAVTFKKSCLWTPEWGDKTDACYNKAYCGDECYSWAPDHLLILDLKAR